MGWWKMNPGTSWVKPFSAAWRGRGYFVIGAIFWVLHVALPIPFKDEVDADWWKVLLAKGVGSLDKISYAVLLAGLAYVVLSDAFEFIWTSSLQSEARAVSTNLGKVLEGGLSNFRSGLTGLSYEAVKVWVEGGHGGLDNTKVVGVSALKTYYAPAHPTTEEFIEFVIDDIVEHSITDPSQVWDNYSTSVVLRPSKDHADHFEWEEDKTYNIICKGKKGSLPFILESSTKVGRDAVVQILDQMRFRISFDGGVDIDFQTWWEAKRDLATGDKFRIEGDGHVIDYNGVWLSYEVSTSCEITRERTAVSIYEKTYVSDMDRCYALALRRPTRNLKVKLSIEGTDEWIVKPAVVSADLYMGGSKGVTVKSDHVRVSTATVFGWTLPGLAVVIEWTPER